jgi:DNA-binding transcriptional LysR family regulator
MQYIGIFYCGFIHFGLGIITSCFKSPLSNANIIDQWLIDRRIEIGFVNMPDDRFDTIPIVQDEFVVLIPERHLLAQQDEVTVSSLDGLPFIMTEAGCGSEVQAMLSRSGAKPKILFHMTQIISILGVVQSGLALSIVARLSLPEHYPGVIYRSLDPRVPRIVALAVKNRNNLSPIAQVFWDMVIQAHPFPCEKPKNNLNSD